MGLSYGGSFQSFLSEEGGEAQTMRDDVEGGQKEGPARRAKLGKMLLARILNGSSYSASR